MNHFATLEEYCRGINIPTPKWEDFDIRSFQENMKTVHSQMPPFKHEFYAIALKVDGTGFAKTGNHSTKDLKATIFFNSPYQVTQWDIAPDWQGYYIMFHESFYRGEHARKSIGEEFPFLMSDLSIPLMVNQKDIANFLKTFEEIKEEHQQDQPNNKLLIFHLTHILLNKVKRLFHEQVPEEQLAFTQRNSDVELVSRFQALIETSFFPNQDFEYAEPHKVQFYADQLLIHPNHLNALVKRITSHSASDLIYKHLLNLAKSKLTNTTKSVKEIAFELYYNYPNHFTTFFKKQTGLTPGAFRK